MGLSPNNNIKRYIKLKRFNACLVEQDIQERRSIALGLPVSVGLLTGEACNLRCIMCIQRQNERIRGNAPVPVLDEKILLRFAQQVFPTAQHLTLNTGGEPMLSPTIDLELQLAEEYGVKLEIITNGTLLNKRPGRIKRIARNAYIVSFSFDSPVKKTYSSIRVGACFDEVVRNMRFFAAERKKLPRSQWPQFVITMVVMRRNMHEVPKMVEFAHAIGADTVHLPLLDVYTDDLKEESIEGMDEEITRIFATARMLGRQYKINVNFPLRYDRQHHAQGQPICYNSFCGFLWKRAYIDNLGKIVTCWAPTHPVAGDITKDDFQTIWNNRYYRERREAFCGGKRHPECSVCFEQGYLSTLIYTL